MASNTRIRAEKYFFSAYLVFCALWTLLIDVVPNADDLDDPDTFVFLYPIGDLFLFMLFYGIVFFLFTAKRSLNHKILFYGFSLPEIILLTGIIFSGALNEMGFFIFVPNAVTKIDFVRLFSWLITYVQPVLAVTLFFTKTRISKDIEIKFFIPVFGIIAIKAFYAVI